MKRTSVLFCLLIALFVLNLNAQQFTQQGPKLVGSNTFGNAWQGYSIALSADGNTAIVGGRRDSSDVGAAWVYTRIANNWTEQAKLVGTGYVGHPQQGSCVALSSDGNTAIVGGPADDGGKGAAWVFTRIGTSWFQQGNKLVGTGAVGNGFQGYVVALSADGNTAVLGGYQDDSFKGAAWIFTRTGNSWFQQGNKLVGTGATGNAQQSVSVALSNDGNTLLIGGWKDNAGTGAAWVFTRTGNSWFQQGNKLTGTGAVGSAQQGYAVALSADGNTAIIGGFADNNDAGAVWIFTRVGNTWSQQGNKFAGSGAIGNARQGASVDLSADGNTAIVGGYFDNNLKGAAWTFYRIGNTWYQLGNKFLGSDAGGNAQMANSVAISADGNTALIGGWYDSNQIGAAWVFVRSNTYSINIYNHNLNKTIADFSNTYDTIMVPIIFKQSGENLFVQDINVIIDSILHGNDSDLEISLIHLNVNDTIAYHVGGSGNDFIHTNFDDSASISINNGTAPFTGSFLPANPLSKFNFMEADGEWILKVYDNATGNSGTLKSWGLSINYSSPSSVDYSSPSLPEGYELLQNYPNPFNPSTRIKFSIPQTGFVSLKVYDALGKEVAVLINDEKPAGSYEAQFEGSKLSSGVYFYRMIVTDPSKSSGQPIIHTNKMLLLK